MSDFGRENPREMPAHFFYRSLRVDYGSAVRADPGSQNCSICPRHWYVDTIFPCDCCGGDFAFTANEQRVWYEEYGFWVDAFPKHCLGCRRDLRTATDLRQAYDRGIKGAIESGDLESKKQMAHTIDQLYEIAGDLPTRINENRRRLDRQIRKLEASVA